MQYFDTAILAVKRAERTEIVGPCFSPYRPAGWIARAGGKARTHCG